MRQKDFNDVIADLRTAVEDLYAQPSEHHRERLEALARAAIRRLGYREAVNAASCSSSDPDKRARAVQAVVGANP